jgi:hypothetical protein
LGIDKKFGADGDDKQKINDLTIVEIMVGEKTNKTNKSYIFLLISLLAHFAFAYLTNVNFNSWLVLLILLLMGALYSNQKILDYRIRKGYYGATEYEAMEIIQFILEHAEDIDFTDGTGTKKLMPDPEIVLGDEYVHEGGVVA